MRGSYPSAVVQSLYSTAPADWATCIVDALCKYIGLLTKYVLGTTGGVMVSKQD